MITAMVVGEVGVRFVGLRITKEHRAEGLHLLGAGTSEDQHKGVMITVRGHQEISNKIMHQEGTMGITNQRCRVKDKDKVLISHIIMDTNKGNTINSNNSSKVQGLIKDFNNKATIPISHNINNNNNNNHTCVSRAIDILKMLNGRQRVNTVTTGQINMVR
jgi:hypothetical protein